MITQKLKLQDKIYLGDGVYAAHDGYHIWLWTEDGISQSKPIALEPEVLEHLFAYRKSLLARRKQEISEK